MLGPIFKGKEDGSSSNAYRGVKLLEYARKMVEQMLDTKIQKLINVDATQSNFMLGRGTTDALYVVKIKEEYRDKERKLHMCFVDTEKTFNKFPRKMIRVSDDKERFTITNCKSGNEPLSWCQDKSKSGIRII